MKMSCTLGDLQHAEYITPIARGFESSRFLSFPCWDNYFTPVLRYGSDLLLRWNHRRIVSSAWT